MDLRDLASPLKDRDLLRFVEVLQYVPCSLAAPFVYQILRKRRVDATMLDVRNLLYKLDGAGLCGADADVKPCGRLKALQALCPDRPTVYVGEARTHCRCNRPLSEQLYESFDQQFPEGMNYEPTPSPTRFRAFTYHAGLQFAVFCPKYCSHCHEYYIG